MSLFSKQDYKDGASFVTYGAWIVGLVIVAGTVLFLLSRPAAVVNKTLVTDNIIHKYEWFFDTAGAINARVAQLKAHKALVDSETVPAEKSRLKIELAGQQQSCRDLVQSYNANASKVNVSIFKTDATPVSFSPSICE
jgi:hypothetical protein